MLSSHLGHFLDKPLAPIAKKIRVSPNLITISGFIVTTFAAIAIPYNLILAGVLIIFGGLFDMLDGIIARVNGKTTDFGAFLDSVLDRYSDSFLLLGFGWFFYEAGLITGLLVSAGTLIGTLVISYAKARAEGLGQNCHTGFMERPERMILMIFGTLTGWVLPVMWIMLVLTHVTVIQRVYHVWKLMK